MLYWPATATCLFLLTIKRRLLQFKRYPCGNLTCFIHLLYSGFRRPAILIDLSKQLPISHHLRFTLAVMLKLYPPTIPVTLSSPSLNHCKIHIILVPPSGLAIVEVKCEREGQSSRTFFSFLYRAPKHIGLVT